MGKTPDFRQNKDFYDLIKKNNSPLSETGWNYVGPDEDHGVDFEGAWANSGASTIPASWYLSENGELRLRGKVTGGDTDTVIFTLPMEVRPEFTERFIIPVEDDVHLENIHFRAYGGDGAGDGIPIPPAPAAFKMMIAGASKAYRSNDGITWTLAASSGDGFLSCRYATGAHKWVLGAGYSDVPDNAIWVSDTGEVWDMPTTPWDGINWVSSLAYSPTLDIMVAGSNDPTDIALMTSSDGGVTWTERTSPMDTARSGCDDVEWIPFLNKFIAVSDAHYSDQQTCVYSSDDGITWDIISIPIMEPTPTHNSVFNFGVGGGNGNVVICGNSYDQDTSTLVSIFYSEDAASWSASDTSPEDNAYCCVEHDGVYYIGTNGSSDITPQSILSTTDFSTWTVVDSSLSYVNNMAWSPNANAFIAVGNDFTLSPGARISANGTSWSNISGITGQMMDVWDVDASF